MGVGSEVPDPTRVKLATSSGAKVGMSWEQQELRKRSEGKGQAWHGRKRCGQFQIFIDTMCQVLGNH